MPTRSRPARPSFVSLLALVALLASAALLYALARAPAGRRFARKAYRAARHRVARFDAQVDVNHFQKGNLHGHSLLSDGKAPLEDMVGWYRDHGYQFVAMTEHDKRIDLERFASMQTDRFVVIAGEEITDRADGAPLHVNALCARATIPGSVPYASAAAGIADIFAQVRAAGGVPLLNHPNFHWALGAGDIVRGARGAYLLEIWSGHPDVSPDGAAMHPSAEAIWDDVLASGADVAPAAVDDAHELTVPEGERGALPGRGWVWTFGAETTREAICGALAAGRLYASTGPSLSHLRVGGDALEVLVDDGRATVTFIGERGETLATSRGEGAAARVATYRLAGGETIVRARVTLDGGGRAWTAAYRVSAD